MESNKSFDSFWWKINQEGIPRHVKTFFFFELNPEFNDLIAFDTMSREVNSLSKFLNLLHLLDLMKFILLQNFHN